MKRFLRSSLSSLSYCLIRRRKPSGLRILMYHRVTDAHPTDRLCVPVTQFSEQMRYLREAGYHTWTMAQAVEWMKGIGDERQETGGKGQGAGEFKQNVVVVTFDDGFEDNFLNAHPILQQYGFTGCFFIPSGFIEQGQSATNPADRPMTWAQLRELIQVGHEIGAHSVTHRKLTLISAEEMRTEVSGSKAALERSLQHPVRWFCYPAGDYNDAVKQAVIASGYEGACTVEPGANVVGVDPFTLKRTEVSAFDSLWDFQKKLAGAYDWMHTLIQRAQGCSGRRYRQPTNAITA